MGKGGRVWAGSASFHFLPFECPVLLKTRFFPCIPKMIAARIFNADIFA
jgi:hypothetical protein